MKIGEKEKKGASLSGRDLSEKKMDGWQARHGNRKFCPAPPPLSTIYRKNNKVDVMVFIYCEVSWQASRNTFSFCLSAIDKMVSCIPSRDTRVSMG